MSGPGYTEKDLFYYGGFIGGTSVTYLLLGFFGVESHLIRVIVGVIVGAGLGYAGERAYASFRGGRGG